MVPSSPTDGSEEENVEEVEIEEDDDEDGVPLNLSEMLDACDAFSGPWRRYVEEGMPKRKIYRGGDA